jgi:hypothetical protein
MRSMLTDGFAPLILPGLVISPQEHTFPRALVAQTGDTAHSPSIVVWPSFDDDPDLVLSLEPMLPILRFSSVLLQGRA